MSRFAKTPEPPYYAAVFATQLKQPSKDYTATAETLVNLAQSQPGFLGLETTRDDSGFGITVSYWATLEAIKDWKADASHQVAQNRGRSEWYEHFELRIARVETAYGGP